MNLLEAENLAVRYPNGAWALHHVNFSVEAPSFTAVIGPNGSGKSTLMRTLLGLIEPVRGTASVMGHDSVKEKAQIRKLVRYVPQREGIADNIPLKVIDIVLMGRLLKKAPPRIASSKDREIADNALKQVNMLDHKKTPFSELSGGQKQRVLVSRALAGEGPILILDEPLAGTDAQSQDLIVEVLGNYHRENDVSIIMVTHDLNPIHTYVEDVLLMKNTVVGIGTPCDIMEIEMLKKVYGPSARIVEYAGHRYCITRDSGFDRH